MFKDILTNKKWLFIGTILFILIIGVFFVSFYLKSDKKEVITNDLLIAETTQNEVIEDIKEVIKVDVKGEVKKPGVYELLKSARVIDAINAAGGLTKNAYTKYINLSKILNDENVIIVNAKSEIKKIENSTNIEEIKVNINESNSSSITKEEVITNDKENVLEKVENKSENVFVNINTSTKELLMTLPGIGESKANAIIEERTKKGKFYDIDELKEVNGIGEKLYEEIKNLITV